MFLGLVTCCDPANSCMKTDYLTTLVRFFSPVLYLNIGTYRFGVHARTRRAALAFARLWRQNLIADVVYRRGRSTINDRVGNIKGIQANLYTGLVEITPRMIIRSYQGQFLGQIMETGVDGLYQALFTDHQTQQQSNFNIRQLPGQIVEGQLGHAL